MAINKITCVRHNSSLLVVISLALLVATGCGQRGPALSPVTGHVTFNGKPIAAGQIMFYPVGGRPAMGRIESDGRYHLTTLKPGDGALPGQYRVTIEAKQTSIGGVPPKAPAAGKMPDDPEVIPTGPMIVTWLAPEKYSILGVSPLTTEVKPGENTINFDLK